MRRPSIEDKILDAFKAAFKGRRFDAAEHLLRALELCENDCNPSRTANEAYRLIAKAAGTRLTFPRGKDQAGVRHLNESRARIRGRPRR